MSAWPKDMILNDATPEICCHLSSMGWSSSYCASLNNSLTIIWQSFSASSKWYPGPWWVWFFYTFAVFEGWAVQKALQNYGCMMMPIIYTCMILVWTYMLDNIQQCTKASMSQKLCKRLLYLGMFWGVNPETFEVTADGEKLTCELEPWRCRLGFESSPCQVTWPKTRHWGLLTLFPWQGNTSFSEVIYQRRADAWQRYPRIVTHISTNHIVISYLSYTLHENTDFWRRCPFFLLSSAEFDTVRSSASHPKWKVTCFVLSHAPIVLDRNSWKFHSFLELSRAMGNNLKLVVLWSRRFQDHSFGYLSAKCRRSDS